MIHKGVCLRLDGDAAASLSVFRDKEILSQKPSRESRTEATNQQPQLKAKIKKFLNDKKTKTKDLSTLISWGFRLVEYHKKSEYQAALHASPK